MRVRARLRVVVRDQLSEGVSLSLVCGTPPRCVRTGAAAKDAHPAVIAYHQTDHKKWQQHGTLEKHDTKVISSVKVCGLRTQGPSQTEATAGRDVPEAVDVDRIDVD